jgi:hypothetical protein
VSRQRQSAVGNGSAEVVSIGIGGSHRPDYSRLACGQVAAARRTLGLDLKDFTKLINEMTGWDVLPGAVSAWEDDVIPPGDVVVACSDIAQGAPILAEPLLASIPSAFPADALAGPWITTYEFAHAGKAHYHADIARIAAESGSRIRAVNHPPEPRSQGRRRGFRNEIEAQLVGRHLVGEWQNTSDTRYCGGLQLAVLPGEIVMEGRYTGVGSDVEVSEGFWKWVRLEPDAGLAGVTLREPAELHNLVMTHTQIDVPLTLADVRED